MATKIQPKMLKEFLGDSPNNYDSSSNGFDSYPRNLPEYYYSDPNIQNFLQQATTTVHHNNNNSQLRRSRSRSRAAAEAAFSSFQKLLNAVKSIHYSSTPSPLPRSLSRRLLGKWQMKKKRKSNDNDDNNNNNNGNYNGNGNENSSSLLSSEVVSSKIVVVTVKVKDILRWRSFRDLVPDHHLDNHNHEVLKEDESEPLDLVGPTDDAPATSTCNITVTEEEELPCYGNNDDEGKNWEEVVVASDSEAGPKEVEEYHKIGSEGGTEQQSPVSVLNSPFRDEVSDEENLSTFDQSLANMERTKQRLLQSIQLFESLAGVYDDDDDDDDETEVPEEERSREDDNTIKPKRKDYLSRGFRWFEKGGEGLKEKKECIQGMEKQGQWSKFEDERSEVGVELEFAVLDDLLDEVLFDLCG